MEAILKFNLPEEHQEYALANKGSDLSIIIWDLDQWLRQEMKWNDGLTEKENDAYDKVREKLRDLMNEHGFTFDDEIFT